MPGSTPSLALPYPLPTDQVAQGAGDIRLLAEDVERKLGPLAVSSLPAAPTAGQRALLAVATDGAYWEFVYGGGGYWRFLGGSEAYIADDSRIAVGNAWQDSGPGFTLPYVGLYDFRYCARWDSGPANNVSQAGFMSIGTATVGPSDSYAQITQTGHAYGGWTPFEGSGAYGVRINWTTIGGAVSLRYHNNGSAAAYVSNRKLWIKPVYLTQTPSLELSDAELRAAIARENLQLLEAGLLADPPDELEASPA